MGEKNPYYVDTILKLDDYINLLSENPYGVESGKYSMNSEIATVWSIYSEAQQFVSSGAYMEAIYRYRYILSQYPNFVAARFNKGASYRFLGMFTEALSNFQMAANYNPKDPYIFAEIGRTYSLIAETTETSISIEEYHHLRTEEITAYMKILHITRDNQFIIRWRAMQNLGHTYRQIKKYDKSIEWHEKALRLAQKHKDNKQTVLTISSTNEPHTWNVLFMEIYFGLALVYKEKKEIHTSESYFRKAIILAKEEKSRTNLLDQREAELWFKYGIFCCDTKRFDSAIKYLTQCINRFPNNVFFKGMLQNAIDYKKRQKDL